MTALILAIEIGNLEIVKILLSKSKINVNKEGMFKTEKTKEIETPLCRAVSLNDIDIIQLLLSHSQVDINQKSKYYHESYYSEYLEIYLQEKTALAIAIENNNHEIINILLSHSEIDLNISFRSLFESNSFDDYCYISDFIESEIDEKNALFLAIENNNIEIVELLLASNKIDIDKELFSMHFDSDFIHSELNTIIQQALNSESQDDIIRYHSIDFIFNIVKNSAKSKMINLTKKSILQYAIDTEKKDIIKILLNHKNIDSK